MKRAAVLILIFTAALAFAQDQPAPQQEGQRGQGMRGRFMGQGVAGEITEVKSDSFVVKSMQGKTVTVKFTADTRFMNGREPAKQSDFKVGDQIMVGGTPSGDDAYTANFVVHRPQGGMGSGSGRMGGPDGGGMFNPADMGKTFIAGEVKAIDGTKLTILRPDNQTQTIEVDENTSFKKQRESITLADIKVGDHVMGRGAVKDGTFVPTTLNVGNFMRPRGEAPPPPKQQ